MVPLTPAAASALAELGGRMPWKARAIQRRFKVIGDRHGVRITPHMLRHQFGCDLADSGADVGDIAKLMGHASPATTMGYAEWSMGRQRAALERRVAWQKRKGAA